MDDSSGVRHPPERKVFGKVFYPPPGKHFKFSQDRVYRMVKEGKIRPNEKTGRPEYWASAHDVRMGKARLDILVGIAKDL